MRNTLLMGWNRSIPGREQTSMAHFGEVVGYLTAQTKEGRIAGFEPVFLEPHGGTFNGFFLIRGTTAQLDAFQGSEAWQEHLTRALLHLDDVFHVRASTGEAVEQLMGMWGKHLPK